MIGYSATGLYKASEATCAVTNIFEMNLIN